MVESWKNQHWGWLSDGNEEKEEKVGELQRLWINHVSHWERQLTREYHTLLKWRLVRNLRHTNISWLLSRKLCEKLGRKETKKKAIIKPGFKKDFKTINLMRLKVCFQKDKWIKPPPNIIISWLCYHSLQNLLKWYFILVSFYSPPIHPLNLCSGFTDFFFFFLNRRIFLEKF